MSVRKTVAAKVATKPIGKRAPEPAKRTNTKKAATTPPTKSAPGTIENVSAAAEKLAVEVDSALAEGRTDVLTPNAIQALARCGHGILALGRVPRAGGDGMGSVPPAGWTMFRLCNSPLGCWYSHQSILPRPLTAGSNLPRVSLDTADGNA